MGKPAERRVEDLREIRKEIARLVQEAKRTLTLVDRLLEGEQDRHKKISRTKHEHEVPKARQEIASIAARQRGEAMETDTEFRRMIGEVQKMRTRLQDFINNLL